MKENGFFQRNMFFLAGMGLDLLWTAITVLILLWEFHLGKEYVADLAYRQAIANFNKDLIYRTCAASTGGIYVTPGAWSHVTTLNPVRPENAPDEWERAALDSINKGAHEIAGIVTLKKRPHLRLMHPLYNEPSCIKCHPVSGSGARTILGGISVTIVMEPYDHLYHEMIIPEAHILGAIWLAGVLFFSFGGWFIQDRRNKDKQNIFVMHRAAQTTEALFAQSAAGVAEIDAQTGKFIRLNAKFCEIAGRTEDQLVGKLFSRITHPEDKVKNAGVFKKILNGEEFNSFIEARLLRKDGQTKWIQGTTATLWDPDEKPTSFIAVIQDITEKRIREQEVQDALTTAERSRLALLSLAEDQQRSQVKLRESEERYWGLFKNMPEGLAYCRMVFVDEQPVDWIYLIVNENFEKLTGIKEAIGKRITELVPGIREQDPELFTIYGRVALSGDSERFEIEVKSMNLWFDISVYSPERGFFMAVFDVITDRKRAEQEVKYSHDQLQQLHQHLVQAREDERTLISREIHDELGQALSALKLDLGWIRDQMAHSPGAREKVDKTINLVSDTIKNVQRISAKLRPGLLDDLGLPAACEWYCDEFEKRSGLIMKTTIEEIENIPVPVATALFRILQEGLTNIIRHAKARRVTVSLKKKDQLVILQVKDDGIGMSCDIQNSNASLGLLGIRERIRQFEGIVDIFSGPGMGTTLRVKIPF